MLIKETNLFNRFLCFVMYDTKHNRKVNDICIQAATPSKMTANNYLVFDFLHAYFYKLCYKNKYIALLSKIKTHCRDPLAHT